MSLFRDTIDRMAAYVPGEQPSAGERVIKLNTNENPFPPSPKVAEALTGLEIADLRRYPDAMAGAFRRAAGEVLGVPPEWILPGDGSDDVILMIARSCLGAGRRLAYAVPTFTFYRTQGEIEDAEIVEIDYPEGFELPVGALAEADADVTFVASPNSPSGTGVATEALADLASRLRGLLVVDEAYADFADRNALDLLDRFENVIVLRTLSKGYSLAGLRLGFGVARPAVLAGLLKTKSIYNVGAIPAALGAAAIADVDHHRDCCRQVRQQRDRLAGDLGGLGLSVLPSQANFLLASVPSGDAEGLYLGLKERRILVRYYKTPRLSGSLRITVGTAEENDRLVQAIAELLNP
jgi:histidinol-phosphate aminotransferase